MNESMISDKKKRVKGWYIVFLNALVGCIIASTFPQFSMTIHDLAVRSGLTESILLISDTVKSCGIVAAMIASGFMYNKFGAKRLFLYTMAVAIIPQVLIPQINSSGLLMMVKFLQGTASIIFPVFLVIILNWIEEKDAGLSTAVFNGIFYSGGGIGGTIAGIVISKSDWIMSYYVIALIQIAVGILWLLTVKERPYADQQNEESMEKQAENKESLLMTARVWLLAVSFFATTWTVQAITVDMPLFAKAQQYSEFEIGKLLTAVTAGMIVSCLISGKTSDFIAARSKQRGSARLLVFTFGYFVTILAVLLIIFADTGKFSVIYIVILLLTFGASWGLGAFYSILPEIYDERAVPIVTGVTGGMGDAGMPVAPLVVGVLFGIKGMWNIGWLSCGIIVMISLFASFTLLVSLRRGRG